MPAKKAVAAKTKSKPVAKKQPVTGGDKLENAIAKYTAMGWMLTARSRRTAQLKKPKQFNWGWFFVWLITAIFLFGIPLLIYLIYYWTKQEETITLSLDDQGNVLVNGM